MKILFTRFPLESAYGGAEVQTLSLMRGLIENGHEVSFLGSCPTLLSKCKELGIKNVELRIGKPPVTKWGVVNFSWRRVGMRRKLLREVSRCFETPLDKLGAPQHDVAIFMLSLTEKLLLTDWAVAQGMKVFWIEHDRLGRWLKKNPWLPKLKALSKKVTTIVVSDLSRDLYMELGWGAENIVSIPNGIDIEKFSAGKEHTVSKEKFRIGCIARITQDKGIHILLDAIVFHPTVHLTIIGKGRDEKKLRRVILQNNLQDRVVILPKVNVTDFYKKIDALVLPSCDHDPFGLVIAEAMASGLPTICTDACGIARHLEKEESLITRSGDAWSLYCAIDEVMKREKWLTLAKNGPIVAKNKFGLQRMIAEYEALL